jgi:EAL domain-containing protein (putative c-di-GMP-specific phosphodiesterase class I)
MHANHFIKDESVYSFHREKIAEWFLNLFCGKYDEEYFEKLSVISQKHTKIGLPSHYVNASFNFVRRFTRKILLENRLESKLDAFEKILDINLDFITTNFQESEQIKSFKAIEILSYAIKNNTITPYLQAIVSSKTKRVAKYESLMRIADEQRNIHSPFEFLEVAKKIDRYGELSHLMIKNTFELMKERETTFSINVTEDDVGSLEMTEYIYFSLQEMSSPENVIFEIVESGDRGENLCKFCENIHKLGAKVAIDDFGTGFSNYDRILSLKPDIIKIDGSLIKDINKRDDHKETVRTIVNWAKKLNIESVAEYVWSIEVSNVVESLGVDYMQGFLYSEPKKVRDVFNS